MNLLKNLRILVVPRNREIALLGKIGESGKILRGRFVNIGVVVVDRGHEAERGLEMEKIAVEFIRFVNKKLALGVEKSAFAISQSCANRPACRHTELLERPDEHAGGGGFAVSAGDGDHFEIFLADNLIEKFVAFGSFNAEIARHFELWMVCGKGGGVDKPVDFLLEEFFFQKIAVLLADMDLCAFLRKFLCHWAGVLVAAKNLMSGLLGDFCERAEPDAADS